MHFPTWVDLKGQDSIPETVHHVVCYVDPVSDTSWHKLPKKIQVSLLCEDTPLLFIKDNNNGCGPY